MQCNLRLSPFILGKLWKTRLELSIAFAWKSLKFDSRGWWWSFLTVADVGDFLTIFLNFRLVDVNSKAGNAALNKNPTDSTL